MNSASSVNTLIWGFLSKGVSFWRGLSQGTYFCLEAGVSSEYTFSGTIWKQSVDEWTLSSTLVDSKFTFVWKISGCAASHNALNVGDGAALPRSLNLTNWKRKMPCGSLILRKPLRILDFFSAFLLPGTKPRKQSLLWFRMSSHWSSLLMQGFAPKESRFRYQTESCK